MAILLPERDDEGVRTRHDNSGSAFGNLHRERLPRQFYMSDIDGVVLAENSMFTEFCAVGDAIAFAALFDLKQTAAACEIAPLRRRMMCALAVAVGRAQPLPPMCFEIVGSGEPLTMYELNPLARRRTGRCWVLTGDSWLTVWADCGLTDLRSRLTAWLR
ncbi:MAG: hypothetical protein NTV22_09765 [bacterium]|nr:hypothetical protein [bacterium]